MKTWSVPFITETTDIWEVKAANRQQATMQATIARERWLNNNQIDDAPTHSHVSNFKLGTVGTPVEDPDASPDA